MSLFRGIRYFLLNEDSKTKILRNILGFRPKNIELYEQAFTHSSVTAEKEQDKSLSNERLEFLGDAVLSAIVAEYFFIKYPLKREGELTKLRSKLVSRASLNQLAVAMGLDTFLETAADTKRSKSIFGDAFEAIIGAIYLDKGYPYAKKFVLEKVIRDYVDLPKLIEEEQDFKSKLVEYSQKEKLSFQFENKKINDGNGEVHHYHSTLILNRKAVAEGEGGSKKKAEQEAAKNFFQDSQLL